MLARIASKRTSKSLLPIFQTNIHRDRSQHSSSSDHSGGTSWIKIGSIGAVAAATVIGGTTYLASSSDENRVKIEQTVPYANEFFNTVLGPLELSSSSKKVPAVDKLKERPLVAKILDADVKKDSKPELPPLPKPKKDTIPIVPVDVHKTIIGNPDSKITSDTEVLANERLKDRLTATIKDAESKVRTAREAKIRTIQAIKDHSKALKQAVDDGQNANWNAVSDALAKREKSSSNDLADERDARNYIDNLRSVISGAKENQSTKNNPLLIMGLETAVKLSSQLDELNLLAEKAKTESRVLNQYKDLIDQSRQQFAQELKAVLPDIDIHAKDAKLTEDELNSLIAHAHLKVDQLKRQLTEQQLREEQHIASAIEAQREADQKLAEEALTMEVRRLKDQNYVDIEKKIHEQRQGWELELGERLSRAQSAHAEHLEQVLRTQKQIYDIEHSQAIEEAVTKERHFHSKTVDLALAKLEGIESALQSRAAADEANRRCKLYSIAVHNLFDSIEFGVKSGQDYESRRKPLNKELETIKEICESDEFVKEVISHFSEQAVSKGLYTEDDLKDRFEKVYRLSYATAKIDDNGGGVFDYFLSWLQSKFILNYISVADVNEKFDEYNPNPYEILQKARIFVLQNDFANAIRLVQLLRGEPRLIAKSWIADARLYLETHLLAEILAAHAAVIHLRTIY